MTDVRKIQKTDKSNSNAMSALQGVYRGQPVLIVQDGALSAIQGASNADGFEVTKQKLREPILRRHIVSKKFFKEKEKILATYTERLGQNRQARQYKEAYADLSRQQYKSEYRGEENQDAFRDALLFKVAENFGEVTEQDNVLEYAIAVSAMEQETIEIEIGQVKKMIALFSDPQKNAINPGFANVERMKWTDKMAALEDHLKTNRALQDQLLHAQELLRKAHGQEIRDGYNLIPKAAAILNQHYGDHGSKESAISLAVTYRDEVLAMINPLDVFEVFIRRQEKKRENFRLYIDSMIALFGVDMASSNPSRSKEELHSVRDGLFRVEICGQIFDNIGLLGKEVRRMFSETMPSSTL
ncbi:MAG: hypothetical protein LBB11_01510 [Puniceicoccales bacterium]|nr:hypothetical protein [Puniceicoccales bacterium]